MGSWAQNAPGGNLRTGSGQRDWPDSRNLGIHWMFPRVSLNSPPRVVLPDGRRSALRSCQGCWKSWAVAAMGTSLPRSKICLVDVISIVFSLSLNSKLCGPEKEQKLSFVNYFNIIVSLFLEECLFSTNSNFYEQPIIYPFLLYENNKLISFHPSFPHTSAKFWFLLSFGPISLVHFQWNRGGGRSLWPHI